jgi:hypothetical protein
MDWLWAILALAVMGLLAWIGFRIEPHWASKDGHRFLCSGQLLSKQGEPLSRWRETHVVVGPGTSVQVEQKRMMRRHGSTWTLSAESPDPPSKRVVFVATGHDPDGRPAMMALKLPDNSKALPVLRDIVSR